MQTQTQTQKPKFRKKKTKWEVVYVTLEKGVVSTNRKEVKALSQSKARKAMTKQLLKDHKPTHCDIVRIYKVW